MNKKQIPHKHAALIKAWADGAEVEIFLERDGWCYVKNPSWNSEWKYRIKPEVKEDVVKTRHAALEPRNRSGIYFPLDRFSDNVQFTFDGETGKLKSVKMIKETI